MAVRTGESNPHWYRGRIVSLLRRPDAGGRIVTYVGVFLVDYGRFVENIAATMGATNVRELPAEMLDRPKHLAFAVKLAGLRPQELDLKYDTGMRKVTPMITDKWSPGALVYIKVRNPEKPFKLKVFLNISLAMFQDIFKASPAAVAELKKYHIGADGVRIGQLIVRGKTSKVILPIF